MNRNKYCDLYEFADFTLTLKNSDDFVNSMLEMFTNAELETFSKRWRILKMLSNSVTQREIAQKLKVSLCKVTRGSKILKNKNSIISNYLKKGTLNDSNKQ